MLLFVSLASACTNEGELLTSQLVARLDSIVSTMEQHCEYPKTAARQVVHYLDKQLIDLWDLEGRLDDYVRTLNPPEQRLLEQYTLSELARLEKRFEQLQQRCKGFAP